ncbi:MAG: MFS transporter [Alphaproteobacteria bacterium]|nr:MFS transporter [Alphaproteobacteria bacterium]
MTSTNGGLDSRTAWITACASLAVLTISYGAPLIAVMALKPIAAELDTARAGPAGAGALTYIGGAFGGIVAGWLSGRLGVRWIVMFGGTMVAAGLVVAASGGLFHLYVGHGVLMGLLGNACMFAPLLTYVSRWFERNRGSAVALISSGQAVAGGLWPPLIQIGLDELGWRRTMMMFAVLVAIAIVTVAAIFLHPPPESSTPSVGTRGGPRRNPAMTGLPPNLIMITLMVAVFCCCVPMAMPMQHVVAYCGDLGFASQHGAAMLSVLLGSAFLARQFWGWLADRIGAFHTLLCSSLVQATALTGFLLTKDQAALFAVSSAFGLGMAGLVPAYVIAIRECYRVEEAAWRIPLILFAGSLGMAVGGWGAGLLYDRFASYLPAFGAGVAFNLVNLAILSLLVLRQRGQDARLATA